MNSIDAQINFAARCIRKGELVAFPTETVYGLGASVFNTEAIEKIFKVKKRPQDNPLIVHISSLDQLSLIADHPSELFFLLAKAFFPGPLTILLSRKREVPSSVSAGLPTIGVRMPAHSIARRLITASGTPLVAPSANLSGKPSSTTAEHVRDDFGKQLGYILDGGACQYGIESTVITLSPSPMILRPGAISKVQIEKVLDSPVELAHYSSDNTPLSPGMKYRHYAPKAKVTLISSVNEAGELHQKKKLLTSVTSDSLYAQLRAADAEGKEEILIVCDNSVQQNEALYNRILRASQ